MTIRNLEISDISELSKLHKNIFGKTHFSSTFSLPLLEKYFYELLTYNQYKFVSVDNEKIIGYLIAGKNADKPVHKFFKKNFIQIFSTLLFNPVFFVEKIVDFITKFAWRKDNIHFKHISVYLIAVDSHIQNKGIGKSLLQFFENDLRKNKIFEYTLAVRKDNNNAIEFYKKNNFCEVESDHKSISFIKYLQYD